ncbi:MAG TPA: corrinoid protein [Hyphomicrobiaceae bacterium]|nr:corrinoid protein [Hyphomicrobiaceae bacterium]
MSNTIETIKEKCVAGKRAELAQLVKQALDDGVSAKDIMMDGLIPAMAIVGEKYSSGEFFLPQMMIAARAMTEAMDLLKEKLVESSFEKKGKVVLGTVAGDFHDIGKNIVKVMLEGGGYEVVDLGVDAPVEKFVEVVQTQAVQAVLMSSLITLTMESMRRTIEALEQAGVRKSVLVGVGGAPVTQKFADEIGADFYSEDAYGAVERCNELLQSRAMN